MADDIDQSHDSPAARAVAAMGVFLRDRTAVTTAEIVDDLREQHKLAVRPGWVAKALRDRFGWKVRDPFAATRIWERRPAQPDVVDLAAEGEAA